MSRLEIFVNKISTSRAGVEVRGGCGSGENLQGKPLGQASWQGRLASKTQATTLWHHSCYITFKENSFLFTVSERVRTRVLLDDGNPRPSPGSPLKPSSRADSPDAASSCDCLALPYCNAHSNTRTHDNPTVELS